MIAPTDLGRACYRGDEWSAIGVQKHAEGDWSLWSTRVASCPSWTLVHSRGTSYKDFPPANESVRSQGTTYGGMDGDYISQDRLVWFEDGNGATGEVRVHTSTEADPANLQRVDTYSWRGDGSPPHDVEVALNTAVHLDEARGRWWLIYRNTGLPNVRGNEIRFKTAPVSGSSGRGGGGDVPPPSDPPPSDPPPSDPPPLPTLGRPGKPYLLTD